MISSDPLSVALADRTPLIRSGFQAIVGRATGLSWLGSTGDPATVLAISRDLRPNILVLDSAMGAVGHLVRTIAEETVVRTVVILVGNADRTAGFLSTMLNQGAHGLVAKSAGPAQLVSALRLAHTKRRHVDGELASLLEPSAPQTGVAAMKTLTRREFVVLQMLGDGLDNAQIADVMFLGTETIRSHVKAILRKLQARNRTHAVGIAYNARLLVPHQE